jgi:hypothetical protein
MLSIEGIKKASIFSRKKQKKTKIKEEETNINFLLCRFVVDRTGKKIGESVAVDKDIIIVKTRGKYLGVPLKHIEKEGKTLSIKGLVDFDKAEEIGEKWQRESFQILDQSEGKRDES